MGLKQRGAAVVVAGLVLLGGYLLPVNEDGSTALDPLVPVPAQVAFAGEDMCAGDPIIEINGERINIVTKIPTSALKYVSSTNPVRINVHVPRNTRYAKQVSYTGEIPELLTFVTTGKDNTTRTADIYIEVLAPAPHDGSLPYKAYMTATSALESISAGGQSGRWFGRMLRLPWRQ